MHKLIVYIVIFSHLVC